MEILKDTKVSLEIMSRNYKKLKNYRIRKNFVRVSFLCGACEGGICCVVH